MKQNPLWFALSWSRSVLTFAPAPKRALAATALITVWLASVADALALGAVRYVQTQAAPASFPLLQGGQAANLWVDAEDWPAIIRATKDLQLDLARVSGITPSLSTGPQAPIGMVVIVGSMEKSRVIKELVRQGKLTSNSVAGKWEACVVQVVSKPLPGVEQALVIAGSDKRGTIYGIYDLSEQIGVSPWYWWADVPAQHHDALFVASGTHILGPPAVKYRGIFLNDEAPALSGWTAAKFGGMNHKFYTNVFELILRLRGNYLWPAMWNNSFATDDPLNARLADEYGIVLSTSHHEPMMRAWKEWERAGNRKGSWDYSKNAEKLREFWAEGLRRTKDYEKVITLAMRGDGDEPMSETESVALLERIVADQRQQIAEIINPDLNSVPQVWALYKEVQGYYERGMRVPDDVTLLWCDDNWGNIRRLPTREEQKRSGGAGVYYHFDYVGGPRNYKWLNVTPISKVWEQLTLAYHHEANRIWVVNVGDLKPMEIPIEFFLSLAWNPDAWPKERMADYLKMWAEREFGREYSAEIADIVSKYTKYNRRRTPELLEVGTFSLVNYQEADRIVADWTTITEAAEAISAKLPETARAAFFQLVLHPTKACCIVNKLYAAVARNRLHAKQARASANDFAAQARDWFKADADLSSYYNHTLAGGKWNHLMDQTHIGYTYWQQPPANQMPKIEEIEVPEAAAMGVAIEGSDSVWPGASTEAELAFDVFNQPQRCIEVFNKGRAAFEFQATASAPWIMLDTTGGKVEKQTTVKVSVDWLKAPKASTSGTITITGAGSGPVTVRINTFNPESPPRDSLAGFVEADGYVSMEAAHFTRKTHTASARWEEVADLGRTLSAMTIFPFTTASVLPPDNSPALEYQTYLFSTGKVEVTTILAPCLNFTPDRAVRIGVSFDNETPQILTIVPKGYVVGDGNRDWEESVRNSARYVKSTHAIGQPGYHALKIWMVDPAVPVQKIVINTGGLKPSYLGPPESFHKLTKGGL